MKKLIHVVFAAVSICSFSQELVSTDILPKNVLIEEFTAIGCGNCPIGHSAIKVHQNQNPGRIISIRMHHGSLASPSQSGSGIDLRTTFSVSVSPSPANEILNIEFNSKLETENATISISNLLGKEIIKLNQVTSNKTSINVSSLTNGIYFVNTNLNEIISSEKIVILH
jgi:hypothetical protein